MPTVLTTTFNEKSTGVIIANFTDEDGKALIPISCIWTLTDSSGNVINSRNQVSITPSASIAIVLQGDDFAISGGFSGKAEERRLTIEARYHSTYGSNLPLKDSVTFFISNLIAIT
jgi:hypothetical protein